MPQNIPLQKTSSTIGQSINPNSAVKNRIEKNFVALITPTTTTVNCYIDAVAYVDNPRYRYVITYISIVSNQFAANNQVHLLEYVRGGLVTKMDFYIIPNTNLNITRDFKDAEMVIEGGLFVIYDQDVPAAGEQVAISIQGYLEEK